MPLYIVEKDIVTMPTDAIVNPANTGLIPGGGACGAIFAAAGYTELEAACRKIGSCPLGQAVLTPGFKLSAKYVIHVAGPIWEGGQSHEAELLASCYEQALILALEHGCHSIAFPLISTGIYGYPKKEALHIALAAIRKFLQEADLVVYLVVYDRFKLTVSEKVKISLDDYLSKHYENILEENTNLRPRYRQRRRRELEQDQVLSRELQALREFGQAAAEKHVSRSVKKSGAAGKPSSAKSSEAVSPAYEEDRVSADRLALDVGEPREFQEMALPGMPHLLPGFAETLFKLIKERGLSEIEVYQRANLDRKLFSKIRKARQYKPSKATALSLAIALQLSVYDAEDLLARAGYAFSPAVKADVIVQYCFEKKIYDIIEVNEILGSYGEKPFGP
ncbi:MAG: macro domain-containing protein [Acidaminococcaceae bacterium]|nr:macro domain-containing protein [Acidaminococcaceae bacterium]